MKFQLRFAQSVNLCPSWDVFFFFPCLAFLFAKQNLEHFSWVKTRGKRCSNKQGIKHYIQVLRSLIYPCYTSTFAPLSTHWPRQLESQSDTGVNSCSGFSQEHFQTWPFSAFINSHKGQHQSFRSPLFPIYRSSEVHQHFFLLLYLLSSPPLLLLRSINHVLERRALCWDNFLGLEWVIN